MCGRTACTLNPQQISAATSYRNSKGKNVKPKWRKNDGSKYRPSYNKAPQSFCPVLLHSRHINDPEIEGDQDRVIAAMKWGLVPNWVKDPKQAQYKMNNARSDSMLTKASYKRPLEKGQRCVVLADGFYEWNTTKKDKQPYYIYFREDKKENIKTEVKEELENGQFSQNTDPAKHLLTMAGIFEHRKAEDDSDDDLFTFSVITVDSHPAFSWLHHRMPAILENDDEVQKWLDSDLPLQEAVELIRPTNCLAWHPVSKVVNNSRNNQPECMEKIDLSKKNESKESKGMAKWLSRSPVKVKAEIEVKKEPRGEPQNPVTSPKKSSPQKKGQKRQSSRSMGLMEGWLKKAKRD